jgi:hypothetical protein
VAEWTTISALATAGGTLVLAGATFSSVRSANRAARTAERTLLAGLRPLLVPSRLEDPIQKVYFYTKHLAVSGGGAAVEIIDDTAIYMAISVRNAGTGIGLLHGWSFHPGRYRDDPVAPEDFVRLTRDIYVPAGDIGYWQGTFRDPAAAGYAEARQSVEAGTELTIDVLYGDLEGGQRVITRFVLMPRGDGSWGSVVSRYWNVDAADPR